VVELEVALLGVVLMSPARYEPNHIWTQRRRGELTVANDPELRRRAVRRLNLEAAYRGQAARRRGAETSRSVKISRSVGTGDSPRRHALQRASPSAAAGENSLSAGPQQRVGAVGGEIERRWAVIKSDRKGNEAYLVAAVRCVSVGQDFFFLNEVR
jgi:hypothetical protein